MPDLLGDGARVTESSSAAREKLFKRMAASNARNAFNGGLTFMA